jgi:hypothetical protein
VRPVLRGPSSPTSSATTVSTAADPRKTAVGPRRSSAATLRNGSIAPLRRLSEYDVLTAVERIRVGYPAARHRIERGQATNGYGGPAQRRQRPGEPGRCAARSCAGQGAGRPWPAVRDQSGAESASDVSPDTKLPTGASVETSYSPSGD